MESQKSASKTPELSGQKRTHADYTVGWICARFEEQKAATTLLDHLHKSLPKPPNGWNAYTLGSIGDHNIVIVCLPEGVIGTNESVTVATSMVHAFPFIKIGHLVRLGGGIPLRVRLGDVVVSTPTSQFPGVVQ
ncbi:hypothetical protein PT974_10067 [Cladobotryum mycophilum]|uniref:Nucleoside phosphorylase domain-containing protein n=1 Tax=Cladobotryum mycophilum TaxID=491253 RepID=A0ABR0S8T3_9HYPO